MEDHARLVGHIGWRLGSARHLKLRGLTVKIATHLQLQAVTESTTRVDTSPTI